MTLPVAVEDRRGPGALRFKWDGRGMRARCAATSTSTHEMTASGAARTLHARGLAAPERRRVRRSSRRRSSRTSSCRCRSSPRPRRGASWSELIAARGALCRAALGKAESEKKIQGAAARDARVTLPRRLLERPLRLPLAVERAWRCRAAACGWTRSPRDVIVTPARLWYGVAVALGEGERRYSRSQQQLRTRCRSSPQSRQRWMPPASWRGRSPRAG